MPMYPEIHDRRQERILQKLNTAALGIAHTAANLAAKTRGKVRDRFRVMARDAMRQIEPPVTERTRQRLEKRMNP